MKAAYRKGFTLIEILIVVIILGILAAIVIPQFTNASDDAKLSSLQSTAQSVQSQIELYKLQSGNSAPGNGSLWACMTGTFANPSDNTKVCGPYLQTVPRNPFSGGTGVAADTSGTDWAIIDGKFMGRAKTGSWYPQ